jgi:hypothetical protein
LSAFCSDGIVSGLICSSVVFGMATMV